VTRSTLSDHRMPIDYSKWDKLEVSSSEDEDDDQHNPTSSTPRVTRLDAPSKVTFGGGSVSASVSSSKELPTEAPPPLRLDAPAASNAPGGASKSRSPSWTDHGGVLETKSDPPRSLYWTQDRYSVTLRVELIATEKVRSVCVEGILPYCDRHAAVGSTKPKLACVSEGEGEAKTSVFLLEGELPHPVHLAEEDSDDGVVDWSVVVDENNNHKNESDGQHRHRFLVITLHKAVPMQGLSVWWRRPLMGFPEADLDVVRGDRSDHGLSSSSPGTKGASSREFLESWEEAHKIFREGKQKRAAGKALI